MLKRSLPKQTRRGWRQRHHPRHGCRNPTRTSWDLHWWFRPRLIRPRWCRTRTSWDHHCGSGQSSSDSNHSSTEDNIDWYTSTPNALLLSFVHETFEKLMIEMFEREEYRKLLMLGKKVSLPWQTVTKVLVQSDHPFAQRFARKIGDCKYLLSEKLRSKIKTMCELYIDRHFLTNPKDYEVWVDRGWN